MAFYDGMIVGFIVVVLATIFADKLGTFLFHRGYVRPFYVKGRRMHHFWIYLIVPVSYVAFCVLFVFGYVLPTPIWSLPWYEEYARLGLVAVIAGGCIAFDLAGDKWFSKPRNEKLLHHEWLYALILVYVVQFVIEIRI
jgi:hypothetical protein